MNIQEYWERNREMRKYYIPIAKQCFRDHKTCLDYDGRHCNAKTNWFVFGLKGESEGVGLEEAKRLVAEMFRDRTGAVSCNYSQPVLPNELPALEYKHDNGLYMKLMFKRKASDNSYIMFIDIHRQKENDLWELYGDDYR